MTHPNDTTEALRVNGRLGVARMCLHCGKPFVAEKSAVKKGDGRFCSRPCGFANRRTVHEERACRTCGATFTITVGRIKRGDGIYCSAACAGAGRRTGEQRRCRQCGDLFYVTPSMTKNGYGQFCSHQCHSKAQRSPLLADRPCAQCGNAYRPLLKTSRYCSIPCRGLAKRTSGRNGGWARHWRLAVFRRDGYTCQGCGQHGGDLHAHHIVAWAVDPTRRFDVANGVTLCLACHQQHHPWMQPYRH